jgi:hypothetical protein
MDACSTFAGLGDGAGYQRYPREHAANRSGPRKPVDQMPPNVRLSDDLIDLMKAFSLSSAQGIGAAWAPLRSPTPFDERFGEWEIRSLPQQ